MTNKHYMTYKHYILANHLPDCMDSLRRYNEEYNLLWPILNGEGQQQYLDATYKYRFIEHMD